MRSSEGAAAVRGVETYYDSRDADEFYAQVWGGEDIHVGLYEAADEAIVSASRRTVQHMAARLKGLRAGARVIDLGAGYGGAARHLASRFGANVTCLNLSQVENDRNRKANQNQGLHQLITVVHGSFLDVPKSLGVFDVVWSQDAFLHAPDRVRVIEEAARVLRPGGEIVFTDPMQADDARHLELLKPIYERLELEDLASPSFYQHTLQEKGFGAVTFQAEPAQMGRHYRRIREELLRRQAALEQKISPNYIARMAKGLGHWVEGVERGVLTWGIFYATKK